MGPVPYKLLTVDELLREDSETPPKTYPEPARKPTWSQLVRLEPRLAELRRAIQQIKDPGGCSFCANHVWYREGSLKDRLCRMVGWDAERDDALLHTQAAYDVGYRTLYELLPDCRDCMCL